MADELPPDVDDAPGRRSAVVLPVGETDPDYHCPNCKFLPDPGDPRGGFWACQNLCVRE